jgi:hypothetical protein
MVTEHENSPQPTARPARDRSVWDVAREAFENSLIEGDAAEKRRKPRLQSQADRSG